MEPTLEALVAALERDGRAPPGWTDEILREAWERCQDAVSLARLAGRVGAPGACGAAQAEIAEWAEDILPEGIRERHVDYATQRAIDELDDVARNVSDCAAGLARAEERLPDTCERVVRAAGLRDWDELLAEAALCSAAPWPNPAYDAMEEHRDTMEQAAHQAVAAIVRGHVPCPTLATIRAGDPR